MAEMEAGFAKLQGEDFEYYMQTYSIVLGRNSKKTLVDVDLAGLGGGMNISRQHARIFYDFDRRRFVLEVVGKNGCYVEGVLHLPGTGPVKLDSQDLLQIGDKKFYFLLPARKIARAVTALSAPALTLPAATTGLSRKKPANPRKDTTTTTTTGAPKRSRQGEEGGGGGVPQLPPAKKMRGQTKSEVGGSGFREKKAAALPWNVQEDGKALMTVGSSNLQTQAHHFEHHRDVRRAEAESEMTLEQLEDREIVGVVVRVLQGLCAPGEWLPMSKLHSELLELYHGRNMPQKVRRLLGTDEGSLSGVDGKGSSRLWSGLLNLLRQHPRHFIVNTKLKGNITGEYVTLTGQ